MVQTAVLIIFSFGLLYVVQLYLAFRRGVKNIGNHPGYCTFFSGAFPEGNYLPRIPGISPGRHHLFKRKYEDHRSSGWDVYSTVSVCPRLRFGYCLADAATIKEVVSYRARFPKPVKQYGALSFFGKNIVASEGDEWKRYRKVTAPSFSERNNQLVWNETCRIMMDMFDNVWQWKDEIVLDNCIDITLPIALFVIGVAGFGRRISWTDDQKVPPGHRIAFKDALHIVSTEIFVKLAVPKWAMGLTQRFRNVQTAFDELRVYMLEMIEARKNSEKKEERYDLFSSLLDANEEESDGEAKLSDDELLGNIYIFLVAGHETTAHTLCYAFGLLALYQDEQETLYQHIKSIIPDGRTPTYEEMNLFTRSMAVLYETLRLYPPAISIPKVAAEDTRLTVSNSAGEKKVVPVPRGCDIVISTPALHYNPRYWEDPYVFRPERFLEKDWPRDAFLPFSAGARACIGRRFFEIEGIAILTMLVSKYKIEVKEEPQFAMENLKQRRERLLANMPGITLTPVRVPLVFKKRA